MKLLMIIMTQGSIEFEWQVLKIRKNPSVSTIECTYCDMKVEVWSDESVQNVKIVTMF
jgi:hypothetical protein